MRDMQKHITSTMQDSRRKYTVIPLVNHLLILSLNEGLNNGNVKHKHAFPPQYGSFNFILSCLFLWRGAITQSQSCGKWKLSEYSRRAQGELCALRAPFHLPCLRLHAELLHDLSLLSGSQRENEVEISSGDIYVRVCLCVCVCVRKCMLFKTRSHRRTHTNTHTHTHTGSISFQSEGTWGISHV